MIVSPDFLDDWKMTMLSDALGRDPLAPVYVLRLWSHCQQKKAWQFGDIPALALASVCKAPHEGRAFFDAMVKASYVEPMGDGFAVPGWAELNAQLIAAWTNGRAGGRPVTKPAKPNGKPSGNPTPTPTVAQGKPKGKPIREDKKQPRASGDAPPPSPPAPEIKPVETPVAPAAPTPAPPPPLAPPAPAAPPPGPKPKGMDLFGDADEPGRKPRPKVADAPSAHGFPCPSGVSAGVWAEFLAYRLEMSRKNSKAPFTATAMKGVVNTYLKRCMEDTGESGDDALLRAMAQGWRAPYVDENLQRAFQRRTLPNGGIRQSQRDIDAERGRALAGEIPTPRGANHEANHRRAGDIEDVEWRDKPPAHGE